MCTNRTNVSLNIHSGTHGNHSLSQVTNCKIKLLFLTYHLNTNLYLHITRAGIIYFIVFPAVGINVKLTDLAILN